MKIRSLVATAVLLAAPATAQTTGFPGINDLTVNGIGSGSTSCALAVITGLPITFAVSAAPNLPGLIMLNFCPCRPNFLPLAPNFCGGVLVPQSFDINLAGPCPTVYLPINTDAAGNFIMTFPPCPTPLRFSVQAAVLNPACLPFLLTQAFQVSC